MRTLISRAAALAAFAALGACATAPETRVTRFHLGQPIARADVAVEPFDRAAAGSLEFATYSAAVARELGAQGFRVAPALSSSEQVATVAVSRGTREALSQGSPFSIGIGGATFGRHTGIGGGVSLPIGKARGRTVTSTELAVQLKRRSDGTVIWEGRAQTAARTDSPEADPNVAAARLASALFAGFPGESGRTVVVK